MVKISTFTHEISGVIGEAISELLRRGLDPHKLNILNMLKMNLRSSSDTANSSKIESAIKFLERGRFN